MVACFRDGTGRVGGEHGEEHLVGRYGEQIEQSNRRSLSDISTAESFSLAAVSSSGSSVTAE